MLAERPWLPFFVLFATFAVFRATRLVRCGLQRAAYIPYRSTLRQDLVRASWTALWLIALFLAADLVFMRSEGWRMTIALAPFVFLICFEEPVIKEVCRRLALRRAAEDSGAHDTSGHAPEAEGSCSS